MRNEGEGYRPMPRDFYERWPQVGWSAAEATWRANGRSIARWIDRCGRDLMVKRRAEYLAAQRALRARERRKNFRLE